MTDFSRYELNKKKELIFWLSLILSSLLISLLFYRSLLFSVVMLPFAGKIREYLEDELKERRRRDFLMQFKDELFILSTTLSTGCSMKDAIGESIQALRDIHGSTCILAENLDYIYSRMEMGGETDVKVLAEFAASTGFEDVVDFVSVYAVCKKTGASVIDAMSKASSILIDKMTIEKEIQEILKRKEKEGLIIVLMPIAIILFLNLCSPEYIEPLYSGLAGRLLMTALICGNIAVYGLIRKVTTIEI